MSIRAAFSGSQPSLRPAARRPNPAPAARADEFAAAAERLRPLRIEKLPATAIITKYGLADAVLYVDPPYLETIRARRDRSRGRDYRP
ncbi:hypothetical protein [Actinomadura opuntiae]|uniref:hypothetical protein n=1 Tax=Actinomadura sp. OS1-43 TaxID=604315 RepID=UPI00255A804F|nr:hypothetical protein [Actinomadura sp. OS1-43]MDL4818684.1 hypothetical protein [Actinomadura sp. OS1-43]